MSSPGMPAARYPLFQPGGRAGFTPAHAVFEADPVPLRAGNGRADDGWHGKSLRVPSALGGWRKKRSARRTKPCSRRGVRGGGGVCSPVRSGPCSRRGGSGRRQRPPLHEGKGLRHAGGRWCVGRPAIASGRLVAGAAVDEGCQRLEQVLLPSARGECFIGAHAEVRARQERHTHGWRASTPPADRGRRAVRAAARRARLGSQSPDTVRRRGWADRRGDRSG